MDMITYFWLFLKASLLSTGGSGNLPILHDDLIPRGWATERHFAESLAIGQITPGPTGLWVISLGYLTAGLPGALLAVVAICIPPLFVLVVDRIHRRIGDHPAVQGFIQHLGLAIVGIFATVMGKLLFSTGFDPRSLLVMGGVIVLALTNRIPIIGLLGLAAILGIVLY
jgi:chromate transporter